MRIRFSGKTSYDLIFFSFLVLALEIVLYKIDSLSLLRPVADDYCFAASMRQGFIGALDYWFNHTQFDLFTLASNLLFVGIPIFFFPPKFATFFSFAVSLFFYSILMFRLIIPARLKIRKLVIVFLAVVIPLGILNAFLLQGSVARLLIKSFSHNQLEDKILQHFIDVSNSWYMWGVVNSSYLIPFIFSFLILNFLARRKVYDSRKLFFSFLLIGTSGYVISSTTFIVAFLILGPISNFDRLGSIDLMKSWFLALRRNFLPIFLPLCLGTACSFFSPGAFERRHVLALISPVNANRIEHLPFDVLKLIAEIVPSIGNVSTLLFGLLTGYILTRNSVEFRISTVRFVTLSTLYFLASFFMVLISELFSYRAYWHYFTLKYSLYLLLFGVGLVLSGRFSRLPAAVIIVTFFLAGTVCVTNNYIGNEASGRFYSWARGLGFGAIGSANAKGDWVNLCYEDLRHSNFSKYYPEMEK